MKEELSQFVETVGKYSDISACPTIQAVCGALKSSSQWGRFRGHKVDSSIKWTVA
jgi:hypothetical protein